MGMSSVNSLHFRVVFLQTIITWRGGTIIFDTSSDEVGTDVMQHNDKSHLEFHAEKLGRTA